MAIHTAQKKEENMTTHTAQKNEPANAGQNQDEHSMQEKTPILYVMMEITDDGKAKPITPPSMPDNRISGLLTETAARALIGQETDLRPFIGNEVRGPDGPVGYGEFDTLQDLQTAACLHSQATGQHWEPVSIQNTDTLELNTVLMTLLDSLDENLEVSYEFLQHSIELHHHGDWSKILNQTDS